MVNKTGMNAGRRIRVANAKEEEQLLIFVTCGDEEGWWDLRQPGIGLGKRGNRV